MAVKLGRYTKAVKPTKTVTRYKPRSRMVSGKPPPGMKTSRLGKGRK